MKTPVLILLPILLSLTACTPTQLVPDPVLVEVAGPRVRVKVPAELLVQIPPRPKPAGVITYGVLIDELAEERADKVILNGRLAAIEALNDEITTD